VVLNGCETWSLRLREEQRLRVPENRVLRIFGPKRDEMMGGWRKLHNEELHNFLLFAKYNYNGQVEEDELSGACSMNWRGRGIHRGYLWENQRERDHWEAQHIGGWVGDNIKMDLVDIGWGCAD
jgi:hypothetical protein